MQNTSTTSAPRPTPDVAPFAAASTMMGGAMMEGMNGFARTMEAWMGVQRRTAESFVNALASGVAMPAFAFPGAPVAEAEQCRARVAGAMHRGIEAAAAASAEFAALVGDQARFAGRIVERSIDCAFGPHAARSPEAIAATGRTILSDCLDNAVATGERAMRLNTAVLERMQETATVFASATGMGMPFAAAVNAGTGACCGGKPSATVDTGSEKPAGKSAR